MNFFQMRRGITRRRTLATILVTALLVFTVPLGVYYYNHGPNGPTGYQCQRDPGLCVSMTLTVKAYHAGQETPYYDKSFPNDPIVDGFDKFLIDVFDAGNGIASKCPYTVCTSIPTDAIGYCATYGCGAFLEIGTTAGTSRSDTVLNSGYTPSGGSLQVASTATNPVQVSGGAANPATCNTGATDTVTGISASQPITGAVTIAEAGLFLSWTSANVGYTGMVSHDTISPGISAVNGDTVTMAYTISLSNTGITTNFCLWLAGLMAGNFIAGSTVIITLTTTAGVTNSFYTWCTPYVTSYIRTTACGTTSAVGRLGIGTGTTPFTSSSVALTSQVGTRVAVSAVAYASPTMYWTTTFTEASTNTIGEVGLFLTLSGNDYLFFATLLSPTQTETINVPYGQTIRLGD